MRFESKVAVVTGQARVSVKQSPWHSRQRAPKL